MSNQVLVDRIIEQLKDREETQTLTPKKMWRSDLDDAISKLDWNDQSTETPIIALMAGLHLWNDNLDTSHSYCQQIEYDPKGDYWHAIIHRMEQDYPNSKYWFRMASSHPVMSSMPQKAAEYLQEHVDLDAINQDLAITKILKQFRDKQGWNSSDFVDLVQLQESGQGDDDTRSILEGLQHVEFRALFDYTYRIAVGN